MNSTESNSIVRFRVQPAVILEPGKQVNSIRQTQSSFKRVMTMIASLGKSNQAEESTKFAEVHYNIDQSNALLRKQANEANRLVELLAEQGVTAQVDDTTITVLMADSTPEKIEQILQERIGISFTLEQIQSSSKKRMNTVVEGTAVKARLV